jgi:putative flippase GtrA
MLQIDASRMESTGLTATLTDPGLVPPAAPATGVCAVAVAALTGENDLGGAAHRLARRHPGVVPEIHQTNETTEQSSAASTVAIAPTVTQRLGLLWQLLRHQVGSVAATVVDFGAMICMVEGLGLGAVPATVIGASSGAVTNFLIGRSWIFRARGGRVWPQALRYVVVSGTSLGLNVLGEYLLLRNLVSHYVVARLMVAALVSILWNFPMQRFFVFGSKET